MLLSKIKIIIKTNTEVWEIYNRVHTQVRTISYGPRTDQSERAKLVGHMIKIGMVKYGVVWYFIIRYGSYGYYGLVWHGMVSYWCEMVLYFSMVWYHMLIFMVWVVCYCMVSIA